MIAIVKASFAQSISINRQFQGTSPTAISKGNNKIGWVTYDSLPGSPYVYHYMDTLNNVVDIIDTNIVTNFYDIPNGVISGQELSTTAMNAQGHLWGLFMDWSFESTIFDSLYPRFYFLYDFDSKQRYNLNLYGLYDIDLGIFPSAYANNKINFLNDTVYITIDLCGFTDNTVCVKWSNGAIISVGHLGPSSGTSGNPGLCGNEWYVTKESLIDGNNRLLTISSGRGVLESDGIDIDSLPNNYHQLLPLPIMNALSPKFHDACFKNVSTYILADLTDNISYTDYPTIIILNGLSDTILPIPTIYLNPYSSICVDHANRIWVYNLDSLYMYDGNWMSFSMQGYSVYNTNLNPILFEHTENHMIEYAPNKFMISSESNRVNGNLMSLIGNGILFVNYNDSTNYSLNHIQGKVFYDANNNGAFDTGETTINNQIVSAGAVNANVYLNGTYNLYVANGAQTVTTTNTLPYLTSVPGAHSFNFASPTDTLGVNFAMQHTGPTNDLRIDLTAGIHRTFQPSIYCISFKNTGSSVVNGTVSVQFNPLMTFASYMVAPTTNTAGNVTWDFTNLQAFETRQLYFYLSGNNNFNIGDTVYAQASITPVLGDAIPTNNTDSTMSIFIGAYDPNMKVVTQNGVEVNTILNDDPLEYVIHFQNVGNDTAFTVIITDTISNLLDLSSLEIIGSSHANNWGIYNRTLQFTFNGINLPDSSTNQLGSNGFVSYRIKPVSNISLGNSIDNRAAIYFDVNAPVITNNAQVTLIDVTGADEKTTQLIGVAPNPAQQVIYVMGKNYQNQTASIYDAVGKMVLSKLIQGNQGIDINGLSKGIYFVELAGQRAKFVKE
jgi:uncharacterized repeat protein (TIGR01451 family)